MNKNQILALIGLIIVTIFWGLGYPFQKILLDEGMGGFFIVAIRFLIGGIVLILIFMKKILKISKLELKNSIILGVILAVGFSLQMLGLEHTSSTNNAFITSTYVVFVPILIFIFFKEKIRKKVIIASITALIGTTILSLGGSSENQSTLGDLLTLGSAIIYAIHIIIISTVLKDKSNSSIRIGIGQLISAGIVTLILGFIFNMDKYEATINALDKTNVIGIFLFLGLLNGAFGFTMQIAAQKVLEPAKVGIIVAFEAVFGAIFGILLIDSEKFSIQILIGGFLLFLSLIFSYS